MAPQQVLLARASGGGCTTCPPPTDPNLITTLYTDNVRRTQAASSTANLSFAPGAVAYFLTRAVNTPTTPTFVGAASLTSYDTHLVQLEIAGTGTNTFYMLADRAGFIDDYGDTQTYNFTPPNAPFTGFYSMGYRGMAWKIPPYMPAGTYRVRFYSYQGGSPVAQFFNPTGATIAEGSLVVNIITNAATQTLQYATPYPTASNPVFNVIWPATTFPSSSSNLRVMVRNTSTNKYYALSPGNDEVVPYASYYPSWEASVLYGNTGAASVRYNSTTLYGGLVAPYVGVTTSANTPPSVPAGYYQVYVDDVTGNTTAPNTYLTTSLSPLVPIQLL